MEQPNIRQQIINQGLRKGKDAGQIDNALKRWTNKGLTLGEFNQISPITNLGKDFLRDVGENVAGLKTITGNVVKSALEGNLVQDAYNLATNEDFIKSIIPAMAEPYGGVGKKSPWTRLQAIKEHPFSVGLDVASLGSLGGVKNVGKGIANSAKLTKFVEDKPLLKQIKKVVAPTDLERNLNKAMGETKVSARVGQAHIQKDLTEFEKLSLRKTFDREQVAKNVVFGTREGSEVTVKASNIYKKIIDGMTKEAEDLGLLEKGITEKNTIAQYLTQTFKELNHADSMNVVENITSGKADVPIPYKEAYSVAKQRWDDNLMGYISQVLHSTKGHGHDPNKAANYFEQVRVSGKTPPKDLAPILEDTANYVLEQIRKNKLGEAGSKFVFDNLANKLTKENIEAYRAGTLNKDFVAINKKDLLKAVKKSFAGTDTRRLERTIADADDWSKIISEFDKTGKIGKNIYLVDKSHLKMVSNSVEVMRRNRLNSMMKKALLSLPKWFVENRFSNWWNNMIAGVKVADYKDAIALYDRAPLQLDELTSYSGFTGETVARSAIKEAMTKALAKAKKAAGTNDWVGFIDSVNELFAAPVTRSEAVLEKLDRFANYLHHLKKEAKARGVDWKDLFEKSKSDETLFWQIYRNVDRTLGDYLGRNLALPNKFYETMSWVYPFWKFPTQTARVATNQLLDHPLKTQLLLHQPARVGYGEWEKTREELDLPEDDYTGGVLLLEGDRMRGLPHKLISLGGNQYEALANLLNQAAGTEGASTMAGFSPLFNLFRIGEIRDAYGNLVPLEGTINERGMRKDLATGLEYEPNLGDRLKFATKEVANTFLVPYRQAGYFGRPFYYTATGRDMYTPYGNILNPFQEGSPYTIPRAMGTDKLGSQWGVKTDYAFMPYNKATKLARETIRKSKKKYRRQYKTKKRGDD